MQLVQATSLGTMLLLLVACSKPPESSPAEPAKVPAAAVETKADEDLAGDTPRINFAKLPPPKGSVYYVSALADGPGEGSSASPWTNWQAALCQLKAGDRLIVLKGLYLGALAIDKECASGTAEAPVEIYVDADAVLEVGIESPGLTLASDHWRIVGLEIEPGEVNAPAVLVTASQGVVFENCHLHNGRGDGLVIAASSVAVTLERCHIHHFGMPPQTAGAPTRAAIRVGSGAREITLVRNGIHNVRGETIIADPEVHQQKNQVRPWKNED